MSIHSEIMGAVEGAVREAVQKAKDAWRTTPSLHESAMLTGTKTQTSPEAVSAQIAFKTHASKIPTLRRDAYGVPTRTVAAELRKNGPAATPYALRNRMEKALESGFTEGFEEQTGKLRDL